MQISNDVWCMPVLMVELEAKKEKRKIDSSMFMMCLKSCAAIYLSTEHMGKIENGLVNSLMIRTKHVRLDRNSSIVFDL